MMIQFSVIATYVDNDQDFYTIEMNEEYVKDEKTFLYTLFREERQLKYIIKYSICQKG